MKKVYLLQHMYQYGKNEEYEEIKILGIYETIENAYKAKKYYKNLPGFNHYSDECFCIDEYELNKGKWLEGFVSVE